ncbi:MAG TPA: disulfide bond formation protein B [Burkholderiaceae bacterium]|nr:disulfide bond formation protein B [Burkholderiaceae bacterium]
MNAAPIPNAASLPSRRTLNLLGFLACAGLLAYAVYVQGVLRIDPCPLCIFQRIGIAACGLVFLLAWAHNPASAWGARCYATLVMLAALVTIGIAARHVWIQHLPEDAVPSCGAGLGFMLQEFPVAEVIRKVLTGSGECHQVNWEFLGLAMPTWVLLAAAGLGTLGAVANLVARRR